MAYRVMLQPLRRPVVGRFAASGSDRAASAAGGSLSGGAASAGGPIRLRAGPGIAAAAPVQSFPAAGGRPAGPASRQAGFTMIEVVLASFLGAGIVIGFMVLLNRQADNERDRASARAFQRAVDAAHSFYTQQIDQDTPARDAVTAPLAAAGAPSRARGVWPQAGGQLDALLPTLDWDEMLVGNGRGLELVDATSPWTVPNWPPAPTPPLALRVGFFNVIAEMENLGEARRVRALLGAGALVLENPPRVLLSAAPPGAAAGAVGADNRFVWRDCPVTPPGGVDDPRCVIGGQMTFSPDAVLAMRGTLDLNAPLGRRARLNVGGDADVAFDAASRVEGTMTFEPDAELVFESGSSAPAIDFGDRDLTNIDVLTAISVSVEGVVAGGVDTEEVQFDIP